jgi:hypothetical protein
MAWKIAFQPQESNIKIWYKLWQYVSAAQVAARIMPPRPIRGAGKLPARAAKRHPEHLGGSVRQHFIPCAAVVFVPHFLPAALRGLSAAQVIKR